MSFSLKVLIPAVEIKTIMNVLFFPSAENQQNSKSRGDSTWGRVSVRGIKQKVCNTRSGREDEDCRNIMGGLEGKPMWLWSQSQSQSRSRSVCPNYDCNELLAQSH